MGGRWYAQGEGRREVRIVASRPECTRRLANGRSFPGGRRRRDCRGKIATPMRSDAFRGADSKIRSPLAGNTPPRDRACVNSRTTMSKPLRPCPSCRYPTQSRQKSSPRQELAACRAGGGIGPPASGAREVVWPHQLDSVFGPPCRVRADEFHVKHQDEIAWRRREVSRETY